MKLHREVLKRAKKLGTVDVALIESGRRDARTLEEIGKLSDADSLRQAYFDFGVVSAPKSHGFKESGNPAGRPAGEKNPTRKRNSRKPGSWPPTPKTNFART